MRADSLNTSADESTPITIHNSTAKQRPGAQEDPAALIGSPIGDGKIAHDIVEDLSRWTNGVQIRRSHTLRALLDCHQPPPVRH
ncbi:hypothetical protein M408DRAFT_329358 [Serendipita vermifera MAFF 305830]|uniref:Uncharacterized protein n=1 Tax=Serendipita vermifera MAFF 305830 TaxID=933852 RepID=A0A0C3AVN1_SERVB|nr:hypothetical protein M408DRAFT_329358 [Serendipita vermifera MAFF 305830]